MKRKVMLALCLAGCMAMVTPAATFAEAEETTDETADGTTEETPDEASEEAAEETTDETDTESAELSDDLYSFSMKIGDDIYQLPMKYEDFVALGWEADDSSDEDYVLSPNSYTWLYLNTNQGQDEVTVDVINFDINERPASECYVGSIEVDGSYDFDYERTPVELPGGILLGTATLEDVKAAYGEPSSTYEGDSYTSLTYSLGSYEEVELYVYKDDNLLKQVEMEYMRTPDDFEVGEVSTEVPDIVANYQAPEALTDDYLDPVVEYMGDLYQLPAPVSAFVENGWTILNASDDDYVSGNSMAAIDMMKENQTVHFYIYNETGNATTYENCMVRELDFHTYDESIIDMKLSGGITLGANSDEIIAYADENGYLYSDDREDGYLQIYKNEKRKNDDYVEFWFSSDGDQVTVDGVTAHFETITGTEDEEE